MAVHAPTLSTVLVSAGTVPVSNLYIQPGSALYALENEVDPEATEASGEELARSAEFFTQSFPATQPPDARLASLARAPAVDLMSSPQRLKYLFETAREARGAEDLPNAYKAYREAVKKLGTPHESGGKRAPLHFYLPHGYKLFTEALFETAVLTPAENAPGNLARLTTFLQSLPLGDETPAIDISKAKILTAYNLMHHTGSTFDRQVYVFHMAMKNLECLLDGISKEPESKSQAKAMRAGRILLDGIEAGSLTARTKRKALRALRKGIVGIDHDHWDEFEATKDRGVITNYLGEVNTIMELIFQAESAAAPQKTLYRRAFQLIDEAREGIEPKPLSEIAGEGEMEIEAQKADLDLHAQLFSIELRARQLVLATGRRDNKAKRFCADDINARLKEVTEEYSVDPKKGQRSRYPSRHTVEERNRLIASFQADVAILMARLGLWSDGISNARAAISGPFEDTLAAAKLLESDVFSPFKKGHGIISDVEIRKRARKGSFLKRFSSSLADAHSNGAIDSIIFGGTGATVGIAASYGASYLFGIEPDPLLWGTAGSFLFSAGRRFTNAWRSEDVIFSSVTGKFDRTPGQSAQDFGRLLVHSAMDAVPWALPSYLIQGHGEGYDLIHKTITKSGGAAVDWIGSGIGTIFNPETYVNLLQQVVASGDTRDIAGAVFTLYQNSSLALAATNLVWRDAHPWTKRWGALFLPGLMGVMYDNAFPAGFDAPPGADMAFYMNLLSEGFINLSTFLHNAMTAGAALLFGSTFLPQHSDAQNEHLRKMSAVFLPAAVVLSTDIAYGLAPEKEPYTWRLIRSGILLLEAYIMMNALGLVKWNYRPRRSAFENARSFVEANVMSNPLLPLVMLTTNAFTAPLGGYIQRNKDVVHPVLIAMQGVAITACILPITLGVSGVLKRKIPIFERAAEGWRDAQETEKNPAMMFFMGAYSTFMGFFSGFNTPYTLNRILRSGTWDVIPAGLRTWGGGALAEAHLGNSGWDSMSGQGLMSGTNITSGNVISSRMWPELSGTRWERESIVSALKNASERLKKIDRKHGMGRLTKSQSEYARREVVRTTIDFFLKAGRVIDPFHVVRPYDSVADRLIPFYAVVMAKNPPTFPQKTNVHFFANLFTMLYKDRSKMKEGKDAETLSDRNLDILLRFAKVVATDPSTYDIVLPLIQTLALARHSKDAHINHEINNFFEENPHIPIMLGINLDGKTFSALDEDYSRIARRRVRWKVRSRNKRTSEYINGHKRQEIIDKSLHDLFVTEVARINAEAEQPPLKAPAHVATIPPITKNGGGGEPPAQ
jgi:hypothetical protein